MLSSAPRCVPCSREVRLEPAGRATFTALTRLVRSLPGGLRGLRGGKRVVRPRVMRCCAEADWPERLQRWLDTTAVRLERWANEPDPPPPKWDDVVQETLKHLHNIRMENEIYDSLPAHERLGQYTQSWVVAAFCLANAAKLLGAPSLFPSLLQLPPLAPTLIFLLPLLAGLAAVCAIIIHKAFTWPSFQG